MRSANRRFRVRLAIWFVVQWTLWLAYGNSADYRELIAGFGVATLSTVAVVAYAIQGKLRFRFHWIDVAQIWRFPGNAVQGTWEVFQALAVQLFTRRAASFQGAVAYDRTRCGPGSAGVRALAVLYTTMTPNSVVFGIVLEERVLLYHQILPGKVRKITETLGGAAVIRTFVDAATRGMNLWLWAALAMLIALVPTWIVTFRGEVEDRLVGLEFATPILVLFLVLLIEGFGRPSFYDLPLTLTFLGFGSGMVFARFLQRWE